MAGAAYSENAHREGVSILEQARALARYVERGVFQSKQALADALNVSRSHVSNLTSFSEIPDVVLKALGDWRRCTFRDASSLLKAVKDPARQDEMLMVARRLAGDETQLGYAARLGLLLGRQPVANAAGDNLKDEAGQVIVERKRGKRSTALAFPSSVGDGLAEFVWSRLPDLVADYRKLQGK